MHLGNPNATWVSAAGIFFAGLFLAFGYLRTKQLLRIKVNGPILWTGGAFGPEAGLIVLPALIIGAVLIYYYTLNRKASD